MRLSILSNVNLDMLSGLLKKENEVFQTDGYGEWITYALKKDEASGGVCAGMSVFTAGWKCPVRRVPRYGKCEDGLRPLGAVYREAGGELLCQLSCRIDH